MTRGAPVAWAEAHANQPPSRRHGDCRRCMVHKYSPHVGPRADFAPATAPSAPLPSTSGPTSSTVEVTPSATVTTQYPGEQAGDVVAGPDGALQVDGIDAVLAQAMIDLDDLGEYQLCAAVSLTNNSAAPYSYGSWNWSLQDLPLATSSPLAVWAPTSRSSSGAS